MTDLQSLPPEVMEVFSNMAADSDCWLGAHDGEILRDYILRATAERDELQGANEYHRLALESTQKQIAELVAERDKAATQRNALDAMLTAQFSRRVPIEQALLDIASGKRDLPTRDECRKWAMKIGVPESDPPPGVT